MTKCNGGVIRTPDPQHDDLDKPMWDLLPLDVIEKVVEVLGYGAKKYTPYGWKTMEAPIDRLFASTMRHLVAYRSGEEVDPESGLLHLAHAQCDLMFMLWFDMCRDRGGQLIRVERGGDIPCERKSEPSSSSGLSGAAKSMHRRDGGF